MTAPHLPTAASETASATLEATTPLSALGLLNNYAYLFVAAFIVTLLVTPFVRRLAIRANVIDHPDAERKQHGYPVAYLGGVAVFLGLLAAVCMSYFTGDQPTGAYRPVPIAIVIGMMAITFTGFADDVWGWDPRLKIAGQLVAAAALAIDKVGVHVMEGLCTPLLGAPDEVLFTILDFRVLNGHLYYWLGTALIAVFVLGGCNAANLIDGLDGLLSGVVGIIAVGLLVICVLIGPSDHAGSEASIAEARERAAALNAIQLVEDIGALPEAPVGWQFEYDAATGVVEANDHRVEVAIEAARTVHDAVLIYRNKEDVIPPNIEEVIDAGYLEERWRRDESGSRPPMPTGYRLRYDANSGEVTPEGEGNSLALARIILCIALLGAVLGFLPHNFKPASIFLGDCGSLLLGYMCVVIILMLGDRGKTYFVLAGLIVFALPIMDTTLAIIRRRLAGTPLSAGDNQHLHHQLKRALGSVPRAVFALYGISALFAVVGVSLVALHLHGLRVRVIYAIALMLFSFIAVVAVKAGQHQKLRAMAGREGDKAPPPRKVAGS